MFAFFRRIVICNNAGNRGHLPQSGSGALGWMWAGPQVLPKSFAEFSDSSLKSAPSCTAPMVRHQDFELLEGF
eukprot:18151_1